MRKTAASEYKSLNEAPVTGVGRFCASEYHEFIAVKRTLNLFVPATKYSYGIAIATGL